jgi:hypothetical protein
MDNLLKRRFAELTEQAKEVEASKKSYNGIGGSPTPYFESDLVLNWAVKAKNLLSNACGKESPHTLEFNKAEEARGFVDGTKRFKRMKAVFLAAREDYEGGYLTSLRSLVQAEMFDSELDQASELLKKGYKAAAAIIAGTVLETTLRELCDRNQISHGKLDKMNADLAKNDVYNANMAKRITALAGIRNSAAHGKPDEFTEVNVKTMIEDIERFLSDHLS